MAFIDMRLEMEKKKVLRKNEDFACVYKKGKSVGDKYVVIFFLKNGKRYNRIAFLASKKVGNAVVRNRARRLMKEVIRRESPIKNNGFDIIFIARKSIVSTNYEGVKKSIHSAISKSKIVGRNAH